MLQHRHDTYWKKISRIDWLNNVDLNTTLFHSKTTIHRRINHIHQIQDDNNMWINNQRKIADTFVNYFEQQYRVPPTSLYMEIFNGFSSRLISNQYRSLMAPPTNEKIHKPLLGIGWEKAPGPDGYTSKFFKVLWDTTSPQIIIIMHNFFENVELDKPFNHTTITLLPKTESPSKPNHFRPIGIYNVVYQIISKLLVDRLRPVLL